MGGGLDEPRFLAAALGVAGPLNEPLSDGFGVGGEGSVSVHTLTGAIEVAFLDRATATAAAVSGLESE